MNGREVPVVLRGSILVFLHILHYFRVNFDGVNQFLNISNVFVIFRCFGSESYHICGIVVDYDSSKLRKNKNKNNKVLHYMK
jgi:hypothetical protein